MSCRPPLALAVFLLVGCGARSAPPASAAAADTTATAGYRFAAPDAVARLEPRLREISGLTVLPSGRLAAVEDEHGVVYELDSATGAVLQANRFAGAGDFEGVEWDGAALWAVTSSGDLFRMAPGAAVERVETPLASRNDIEGLGWDSERRRLLLAAKEDPGNGLGRVRAVYAFDPAARQLDPEPALALPRERLDGAGQPFKPSGIAIHPATGQAYVLSATRRAIAVVGADGTILAVAELPRSVLPQPEAIAFAPDGTLFLASEGPSGPATLVRYSPAGG